MINYLVTADGQDTLSAYLKDFKPPGPPEIQVRTYESLENDAEFRPGVYIFTRLDVLSAAQRERAKYLWDGLGASGMSVRLMNHPTRVVRRFQMLQMLHAMGINKFNVHRLVDLREAPSFPVFIRLEHTHIGALTPILHTQAEFERAAARVIARCAIAGYRLEELLVVSFVDTADKHGVYRKYSAYIIGDEVIPRHLVFNRHWMVKHANRDRELGSAGYIDGEREYLATNPHRRWILDVAQRCHIDYGRIDYSMLDLEQPQIWEINDNFGVLDPPDRYEPQRIDAQRRIAIAYTEALDRLSASPDEDGVVRIPFEWPPGPVRGIHRVAGAISSRTPRTAAWLERVLAKPTLHVLRRRMASG